MIMVDAIMILRIILPVVLSCHISIRSSIGVVIISIAACLVMTNSIAVDLVMTSSVAGDLVVV